MLIYQLWGLIDEDDSSEYGSLELVLIGKLLDEVVDIESFLFQFETGPVVEVDSVLVEHHIRLYLRLVNRL